MAHSGPDYGAAAPTRRYSTDFDMGELASRLGATSVYDKDGNISWWDDFETSDLKWSTTGVGGGNTIALDNTVSLLGNQSLKFGFGGAGTMSIQKKIQYIKNPLIGYEFSWKVGVDKITRLKLTATSTFEGAWYAPAAQLDIFNGTISIRDPSGYQEIASGITFSDDCWYTLKFTADPSTLTYSRLRWANSTYDISEYSTRSGSGTAETNVTQFELIMDASAAENVWLDNFIHTINDI